MKLINCKSRPLAIEEFFGSAIPPYAILSHTWEEQEVTYQQFGNVETRTSINGWRKVQKSCELASEEGHKYIWIDSCCIDKTSSAELSEAINSMFEWYLRAVVCFAYLSDYDTSSATTAYFCNARWFVRGWTLQELIAPTKMFFYDRNWCLIGSKTDLCPELSKITGIDVEVLFPPANTNVRDLLDDLPVGLRMSWASKRVTTRIEDQSYCLLGIFGINMPMLYGEGEGAFIRLQEEIVRMNNDMTLFAWTQASPNELAYAQRGAVPQDYQSKPLEYRGVFAKRPAEFSLLSGIVPDSPSKFKLDYAMTNKGLRIRTSLRPTTADDLLAMPIYCHFRNDREKNLGILLKHQGGGVYVRARPHVLNAFSTWVGDAATPSEIFIVRSITATAASKLSSVHRNAFHFRFDFPRQHLPLVETKPRHLWDAENELFITDGIQNFVAFHRFEGKDMTTKGSRTSVSVTYSCIIACGYSGSAKTPWVAVGSDGDDLYRAAISNTLTEVARIGVSRGALKNGLRTVTQNVSQRYGILGKIKLDCQQKVFRGEPVIG
ncbi:hypothetical protein ACMFMG_001372, partial [Clarireedia jacksonii]